MTMRKLLVVVAMVGASADAKAADMPDLPFLRGVISDAPVRRINWAGPYAGGQVSYGSGDMDFSQATQDPIANMLNHSYFEVNRGPAGDDAADTRISRWRFLDKASVKTVGVGGFAGYNFQYDDTIFGVELNYTHGKFAGQSSGAKSQFDQTAVSGYITQVTAFGDASMQVAEYGSLRVKGAYAFGGFLPYAFGGVALGQANISRNVAVDISYTPSTVPATSPPIPGYSNAVSETMKAQFIYGYSAGLGFDYMLFGNIFVRGEWEYLRFTAPVDTTVNTLKAGLGYKF